MNLPDGKGSWTHCPDPAAWRIPCRMKRRFTLIASTLLTLGHVYAQPIVELTPTTHHGGLYHVSTHGADDGSITATVSGGTAPYVLVWNTGDTVTSITGLMAGHYQVIVTDSAGDSDSAMVTLEQPPVLQVVASALPAQCHDVDNGQISVSVNGGVAPFGLMWSSGDTTEQVNGIGVGTYTVTVTSACGAVVSDSVTVSAPLPLEAHVSAAGTAACYQDTIGLSVTVTGGSPPYSFHWNNGSYGQSVEVVHPGEYSVQVTDMHNCQTSDTLSISKPESLWAHLSYLPYDNGTPFSCDTCNDGIVQVNVLGGTPPFDILWSTGQTGLVLEGMYLDSTYALTVTDVNGCVWSNDSIRVSGGIVYEQMLGVFLFADQYAGGHHVSHAGAEDGSMEAVVVGQLSELSV